MKQFHNLFLMTFAQAPVVVLATRKITPYADSYLPEDKWEECLQAYYAFFTKHHIKFYEYDCMHDDPFQFLDIEKENLDKIDWWLPMWQSGNAANGNILNPRVLICAERLGPSNVNNIAFEAGPTGQMMSEFLEFIKIPLADVAITNLVKAPRGNPRPPDDLDLALFDIELTHMKPGAVVLMGAVARGASKLVAKYGIPCANVAHLGHYHRKGVQDMTRHYNEWRVAIDGLLGRDQDKDAWSVTLH